MFELIAPVAIVIVVYFYWEVSKGKRQSRAIRAHINSTPDFFATYVHLGSDGESAIALDVDRELFCLIRGQPDAYVRRVVPFRLVFSSEIHEDGAVMVSASRPSQLIGAAAGGLVFGGAGAIVGALTGKKKHRSEVQLIELRLMIEDMKAPTFSIPFLSVPTDKSSSLHRSASQQARAWHARAEIAIRQAGRSQSDPGKVAEAPKATQQ